MSVLTAIAGVVHYAARLWEGALQTAGTAVKTVTSTSFGSGVLATAGDLVKNAVQHLAGAMPPSGQLFPSRYKQFDGSETPTGDLKPNFGISVAGALTPTAGRLKTIKRRVTGKDDPLTAPTYHDSTLLGDAALVTTEVLTRPAVSDGDWLYAHLAIRGATNPSSTGWTLIEVSGNFGYLFSRYVPTASLEPSTYTFNWTGATSVMAIMVSVSGADQDQPDAALSIGGTSGNLLQMPRIMSRATTGLSMYFTSVTGSGSATAQGGYTIRQQGQNGSSSGGTTTSSTFMTKTITAAIPVAVTHSYSVSRNGSGIHILIRPPASELPFAVRSSKGQTSSSAGSNSVVAPTPNPKLVRGGDLLVYQVHAAAGVADSSLTAPDSTYTVIGTKSVAGGAHTEEIGMVVHQYVDGETAPTFTWGGTAPASAAVLMYIVAHGDPNTALFAGLADNGNDTTYNYPALTAPAELVEEYWLFEGVAPDRSTGPSGPSGTDYVAAFTQIWFQTTNGTALSALGARVPSDPPSGTHTSGNTATSVGWQAAVYPLNHGGLLAPTGLPIKNATRVLTGAITTITGALVKTAIKVLWARQMAPPVVVQSAKNNDPGTPTSLTVTLPNAITQGNLLVAVVSSSGGWIGTAMSGSGWRHHRKQNGGANDFVSFFTKVAGASESTSITSTFASNQRTAMVVFEVSGADTENAIEWGERKAASGTSQAGATTNVIPDLDVLLIEVSAASNAQGINTQPSGYTSIQEEVVNDGTSIRLSTWYKAQTGSATTSYTGGTTVYAGSVQFDGLLIALHAPQRQTGLQRVQFQSSNNTGAGSVTSRSVTMSAYAAIGNYLVLTVTSMTSGTVTLPSGWTKLMDAVDTGGTTSQYFTLAVKQIGGGEPTSISVTFSSRNAVTLTVSEIAGTYVDFANSGGNGPNVGVLTSLPIATRPNVPHGLLYFTSWTNGQALGTPPAGFLDIQEDFTGATPSVMTTSGFRAIREPGDRTPVSGQYAVGQASPLAGHRVTLSFSEISGTAPFYAGTLYRAVSKFLDGTQAPAGSIVQNPTIHFDGAETPSGDVIATFVPGGGGGSTSIQLDGAETPAGDLIKNPSKVLDGTLTSAGDLLRTTAKFLSGTLTTAGDLVKTVLLHLAGALTAAGDLVKTASLHLNGSETPTGDVTASKSRTQNTDGTLTTAGSLFHAVLAHLGGTLATAGDLVRSVAFHLGGTETPTADAIKNPSKVLDGTEAAAGSLTTNLVRNLGLDGTTTSTGTLVRTVRITLQSTTAPFGDIETTGGTPVVPAPPPSEDGGGRWTKYEPWERGPLTRKQTLEGELRPRGSLYTWVTRGRPTVIESAPPPLVAPEPGVEPPWTGDGPATEPDAPRRPGVLRPVQPAPKAVPKLRPTREASEPTPSQLPQPKLHPSAPRVTQPVPTLHPSKKRTEPPDRLIPAWPPEHPTPVRESAPEPVRVEEAGTTRLPLYSREEVLALARRLRVGFSAPDSAKVTPPGPVVAATDDEVTTGGRPERSPAPSRPVERRVPGKRD